MQKRNVFALCVYLFLIAIGIPWYWPADTRLSLLGVPAWVLIAILVSFIASVFTAYLLLTESWHSNESIDE